MTTFSQSLDDPTPSHAQAIERVALKSLHLRSGLSLLVRKLAQGAAKQEGQFFGAIESKGVMIGGHGETPLDLEVGSVCIVRGFNGVFEFSFMGKVLQLFTQPFSYALLSYPAQVDAQRARKSLRTPMTWVVSVNTGGTNHVPGHTVDLSPYGAMLKSPAQLGKVGDSVRLTMHVEVDGREVLLALLGNIRHTQVSDDRAEHITGLAFQQISEHDSLVLHYLCTKQ